MELVEEDVQKILQEAADDIWESILESGSPDSKQPRCCSCGILKDLHRDGWYGYRCDGNECVPY